MFSEENSFTEYSLNNSLGFILFKFTLILYLIIYYQMIYQNHLYLQSYH
jgi:hypothetical protein